MNSPHEYDINTGKIYSDIIVHRIYQDEVFLRPILFDTIINHYEHILKTKKIFYKPWEQLTEQERTYFSENERNHVEMKYFLNHRIHIEGIDDVEPYSFDLCHYNVPCVLTYKGDSENQVFRLFFALKIAFAEINKMDVFLDYQLEKNFEGNKKEYAQFLDDALLTHDEFIKAGHKEKVRRYINGLLPPKHSGEKRVTEPVPDLEYKTPIRVYSIKELRNLYGMSDKVFRTLLGQYRDSIDLRPGTRLLTPKQVKLIFFHLGDPADVKD